MKNNTELVSSSLLPGYTLWKQEKNWGDCSDYPLPPCWCPDTNWISGALPRHRLSARWTHSEPWMWVTVPVARACLQPRSCRWRCTGRWQTGPRWPPRSESAGSGAFWLQEDKEGKTLKVEVWESAGSGAFWLQEDKEGKTLKMEVWTRLCLFKSACNFGPLPFVYLWRKERLCF